MANYESIHPDDTPLSADAAAEVWDIFTRVEEEPMAANRDYRTGVERPSGEIPFDPELDGGDPSQN